MKILVTGAGGMLGQDLCPILGKNGFEVVKTDINNLDITNITMVSEVLKNVKPDIVIHCAAYTNVDKAEDDLKTARLINSTGTENLAKICFELNITIVYISTDYVFSGESKKPYTPNDNPKPLNNYGLTKLEGEEAIKKYCTKYYITRTSWLYGIHGKNFVETMLALSEVNSEIKVVDDQIGCPTWTVELSKGIVKIIKENRPYGIYHICGSGKTSWYGFASEIFKLANKKVELSPCKTLDFPRPANRPNYSVMENNEICRDWKYALADYMKLRN